MVLSTEHVLRGYELLLLLLGVKMLKPMPDTVRIHQRFFKGKSDRDQKYVWKDCLVPG